MPDRKLDFELCLISSKVKELHGGSGNHLGQCGPKSPTTHGGKSWVSGMDYIPQSKGRRFLRLKLQEKL